MLADLSYKCELTFQSNQGYKEKVQWLDQAQQLYKEGNCSLWARAVIIKFKPLNRRHRRFQATPVEQILWQSFQIRQQSRLSFQRWFSNIAQTWSHYQTS